MNKHKLYRPLALTALIGCSVTFVADAQTGIYVETDLVVNKQVGAVPTLVDSNGVTHIAKFFDANLVNPWGIAESDARTSDGLAIVIDRLWSIRFGDGGNGGSVNALYFTAEGRRFVRATVG